MYPPEERTGLPDGGAAQRREGGNPPDGVGFEEGNSVHIGDIAGCGKVAETIRFPGKGASDGKQLA